MNLLLRGLLGVLVFQIGVLLLYLPWSGFWEQNYFVQRFPDLLRPIVLNTFVRGAVSGLGALDIFIALAMIFQRGGRKK